MLHVFNIFCYSLGLAGSLMLYLFGVPVQIDTGGQVGFALMKVDEEEKNRIKKFKRRGKIGIGLIAVSFLLQMVGELSYAFTKNEYGDERQHQVMSVVTSNTYYSHSYVLCGTKK